MLCKEIGVARSLVYEIKEGRREPTEKVWKKLEAAERAAEVATASLALVKHASDASSTQGEFNSRLESVTLIHRELAALRDENRELRARLEKIAEMATISWRIDNSGPGDI